MTARLDDMDCDGGDRRRVNDQYSTSAQCQPQGQQKAFQREWHLSRDKEQVEEHEAAREEKGVLFTSEETSSRKHWGTDRT